MNWDYQTHDAECESYCTCFEDRQAGNGKPAKIKPGVGNPVTIAFDIDGTLIEDPKAEVGSPGMKKNLDIRHPIKDLLIILSIFKNVTIVIWSNAGKKHAKKIAKDLGVDHLAHIICDKQNCPVKIDIAVDNLNVLNVPFCLTV